MKLKEPRRSTDRRRINQNTAKAKKKIKPRRSSRVVTRRATGLGRQIDEDIEEDKEAEVKIINKEKKVKLQTNGQGHIILKLLDAETEIIKIRDTFFTDCEDNELKEKLKKIHIMTAHKQEETLIKFLKGSKNFNPKVKEILPEVIKECVTCKK